MKYEVVDESDVQKLANEWRVPEESSTASSGLGRQITSIAEIPSLRTFAGQKIEFVVESLIPAGAVIAITGESGSGKSTLATAIGSAIERGVPFAGLKTQRRPVLILDRENPLAVTAERFDRLGIDDSPNFIVWGAWCGEDAPDPVSPIVIRWVESVDPKPVIIVDSFVAFNTGDENDATQVRAYTEKFRYLANLGASVIVLHHSGKGESSKDYRGSSDIKAGLDVGYHLSNLGDFSRLSNLRLRAFKVRIAVLPEVILHYTGDGFEIDGRPVAKTNEQLLAELLIANPRVIAGEFEELAQKISVSRSGARQFLENGKVSGKIVVEKGPHNKLHHLWAAPITEGKG